MLSADLQKTTNLNLLTNIKISNKVRLIIYSTFFMSDVKGEIIIKLQVDMPSSRA